ncbi:MAG: DUF721 domain-containing protein [Kiritimatiellia bacterium]|jgi:transposase
MAKYANPRRRREDPVRWMVDRERFQLPDAEPPAAEPEVAIHDIVKDIFKSIDVRRQPALLEQIREAWRELAGPGAATHARPGYLDRQTLVIFVDSAVWLDELARYERAGILARLQQRFGAESIKALRLQADPEDRRKAAS